MVEAKPPYEVRKLPDLPVLLGTWYKGFIFAKYGQAFGRESHALLEAQETPVFYVIDMSHLEDITIQGVVLASNSATRGPSPNLHHRNNRGTIIVSSDKLVELATRGLDAPTFGNVKAEFFGTVEDALDFVRKEVGQDPDTYEVRKLPDLPVILGAWSDRFVFERDGQLYARQVHALLDAQEDPVFYIIDASHLLGVTVECIGLASNTGATGPNANLHHPMNRGTMVVSSDNLVKMAVKGLDTPTFGNVKAGAFDTLNEALNYVRSMLLAR